MQIILRGQKVKTQLVSKSLAYIERDIYRPKFLVSFTLLRCCVYIYIYIERERERDQVYFPSPLLFLSWQQILILSNFALFYALLNSMK